MWVEGDKYLCILVNVFGGCNNVLVVLGGSCLCVVCVVVEEKLSLKIFVNLVVRELEYCGLVLEEMVGDVVIFI